MDPTFHAALFALGFALHWPMLRTPPYGDEPMHYWLSRYLTEVPAHVSDLQGLTWAHPGHLVFQRPFYYLAMHPFAEYGFEAFRFGHMLFASLLPVAAFVVMRAHGARLPTALFAGAFAAAYPLFAVWGGLGLMDEPMAVLVAFAWAARQRRRFAWSAVLLLLAVWTKETAFFALTALLAWSAIVGWVQGRNRLRPIQLDTATASLAVVAAVALLPIMVAFAKGLGTPGADGTGYGLRLFDTLFVTPWFILPLLAGLAWPRTRGLSAFALFLAGFNLALHSLLGRAVETWYLVLPVLFCGLATFLVAEELVQRAWTSRRASARIGAVTAALGVALVVGLAVLAPPSEAKAWALRPFTGQGEESLAGTYRFEAFDRDRLRQDALEAIDPETTTVLTVDLFYPHNLYPLAEEYDRVYIDSAWFRSVFPIPVAPFARQAETNGTTLLVQVTDHEFFHAINEAYGECRTFDNEAFRVYEAWRCPGRLGELERGYYGRLPDRLH